MNTSEKSWTATGDGVAIIGMAGRFPGANSLDEFWQNLRDGVESITPFSDEELRASGLGSGRLDEPNYVKAGAVLKDIESFDAPFFGFSPREAQLLDPQQRLFLECALEALEDAGYDTETYDGLIGVYAGAGTSRYFLFNLYPNLHLLDEFQARLGTDKDFMPTRVSYKLNLKGPSLSIQTACSTSLVAVHMACQGLLNGECDIALAGAVTIRVPQRAGYSYQEGGILSPDGHCRAFDARGEGFIPGSGAGIVVLKRLEDAVRDRDHIHAVIRGSAINNDGASRVGYTAPSVDGQAEVIAEALAMAGVDPETITYVETHGTATPLGDPIEIKALVQAYRAKTQAKQFCAIGSLKTNIGHLDTAAGVAGLIKTVLALKHRMVPPSLHFTQPNPNIDFAGSPFYVNTKLTSWEPEGHSRRAGVSSFGLGGTNAHLIVEEAPAQQVSGESRPWQLLALSASTASSLEMCTKDLSSHLRQHRHDNLADVAYTLKVGRRAMSHRRMLICHEPDDAVKALETLEPHRVLTAEQEPINRRVVFMFPGGGAQYVDMCLDLYRAERVFRREVDLCAELLRPQLGYDLREYLYPNASLQNEESERFNLPSLALPALFVTEYALARLWMSWGIHPDAMIGHSLGEYVAGCLAGVFSLDDALSLVVMRGRLFERLPKGAMLSLPMPEAEVRGLLNGQLSLAAVNGPSQCVLSGPVEAIDKLADDLKATELEFRRLHIEVAAHSAMVGEISEEFGEFLESLELNEPQIPFVSNATGTWITPAEARDAGYWVRHLRDTVRFGEGLRQLFKERERILLEVGPGNTLCTLARQNPEKDECQIVIASARHTDDKQSDQAVMLAALGKLWLAGTSVDWSGFYAHESRQRLSLPTYPFERQRYWIEPPAEAIVTTAHQVSMKKKPGHG